MIEVEHGLRNIMLMPPQLLDAPAYWEAIAAVLPQAEAMVRDAPVSARETVVTTREVANEAARRALTGLKLGDQCKQTDTRHVWLVVDAGNVANAAGWVDLGAYTVPAGGKGQ